MPDDKHGVLFSILTANNTCLCVHVTYTSCNCYTFTIVLYLKILLFVGLPINNAKSSIMF